MAPTPKLLHHCRGPTVGTAPPRRDARGDRPPSIKGGRASASLPVLFPTPVRIQLLIPPLQAAGHSLLCRATRLLDDSLTPLYQAAGDSLLRRATRLLVDSSTPLFQAADDSLLRRATRLLGAFSPVLSQAAGYSLLRRATRLLR